MGDDRAERRQSPYGVSKRARQACGNCRRKKSKCTGEKPACSFCVRLQQDCVYARHQHSPSNHEEDLRGSELATSHGTRLSAIETQLKQMAAAIERNHAASGISLHPSSVNSAHHLRQRSWNSPTTLSTESCAAGKFPVDTQPPFSKAILSEGIKLFFSEYYNQPCPLLSELYTFNPETDDPPPSIILYPMLALSMRSSHTYLNEGVSKWELLDRFTRSSWDLFAEAYSAFDFNDEYLLGLCILVQVDAGDGRMERARTQVSLGLQVAQSQGLLSADSLDGLEPIIRTRRQEIVWSLFLLDRMMLGASSRYPSLPSAAFELPLCGNGPTPRNWNPQMQSATSSIVRLHTEANHVQYSVLSLNIKIMSIWENVIVDVTRSPSDTDVPLWRHNSPRASLLTQIMEFETICQMSFHHYSSTGPPTRVLVDPSLRDYFVVWIYFQLVLSVTQCCLNHPFIIYTQTIHHRHVMPITFLQKSYEQSMIYANWVARLLDDIENAHLAVRNPFLGRLVAIAASIHLEYTINQNPKIAVPARMKFERCVNFVKRVAQEWPDMMKTVNLLEQIKARIHYRTSIHYVEDKYDGAVPSKSTRQVNIEDKDVKLMRSLFDLTPMSPNTGAQFPSDNWGFETGGCHNERSYTVEEDLRSASQTAEPSTGSVAPDHAFNLDPSTVFEDVGGLHGDWSLFGKSCLDYFPIELANV